MWHIDTTVIRLLDGTRAYLHAVIDNFSRRILAWRVADTFAPVNSVTVLLDASRAAAPSDSIPVVLADAGVENVNAQVDALIETGVLRRLLAFTELQFSNSMIEAWWRSLKHQWLFLHSLDSITPSVAWWRSTWTNTTACFRIRRFADRRLTRCTSAQGARSRQT
jgi:putative transposase